LLHRRFVEAFGVSASGAVLVRADGFVAWRAVDAAAANTATMRKSTVMWRRSRFALIY
jgi:hypothetical protein